MIEGKKVVILSTVHYTESFYRLSQEEKDAFHQNVAELMGRFGLELVARYKVISKPDEVLNIFETRSLDELVDIRNEIERLNYGIYIKADWRIAMPG